MGAPTAPVEAPQEPVAEPEVEASPPQPEPETPAEGGGEGDEGEGVDLGEALKGLTAAQLRAVLENAPSEARQEIEAELERKGEERARTRTQERQTAVTNRQTAFSQQKAVGESAHAWLQQTIARAEQGDFDAMNLPTLRRAAADLRAAGAAENALEVEAKIAPLVDKYLPDLTDEEGKKLDKPLYEFARTGVPEHVPVVMELYGDRKFAEGLAEGMKKGEGNKKAREELIEKLQNATKIKQQTAGVTPNGRAANPSDVRQQLVDEINAIDPFRDAQAQDKLDALRYKLRQL